MKRPVRIALAALMFAMFWLWPATREPAHQTCDEADGEGIWGYDLLWRGWTCGEWSFQWFDTYGVETVT